ncbi:hypothetical protein ABU614_05315 [Lysobacter firmicutimachus]|uniref:Uncharacterized protein n=1 Tax=Lysobacter firmicutimachus TaxID=1792846 RepID=A0AAU8MUS0_9GAMM|nr:hypothetical protein [Lysobacter antibioticus]
MISAHTPETRDAFETFLRSLAEGSATQQDWRRFTIAQYQDPALELARVALVRASQHQPQMPTESAKVQALADEIGRRFNA